MRDKAVRSNCGKKSLFLHSQRENVLILGGGIAGLTVADELAALSIPSTIIETASFLGGHAVQFACKATDSCQKCGVCLVEERLGKVVQSRLVTLLLRSSLKDLRIEDRSFEVTAESRPAFIDSAKCSGCGVCVNACPAAAGGGAISEGYSVHSHPGFAINPPRCLRFAAGQDCTKCRDICPERAIDFNRDAETITVGSDAIVVAIGFTPFDPASKKLFGYGTLRNVISGLDLERALRRNGRALRPSDDREAERIAFVQCVGSREKENPYCSQVCCAYSLRLARTIKARAPQTDITIFYIDIQNVGKDFEQQYKDIQDEIRMVRMLPGDILQTGEGRPAVNYLDPLRNESVSEEFDLVVLSAGFRPARDGKALSDILGTPLADGGFFAPHGHNSAATSQPGIFLAGTVRGPMSIPQTIADAGGAAWEVAKYLAR